MYTLELMVDRIRMPFMTPDTAEATNAATMIAPTMVQVTAPEEMPPSVRVDMPPVTRKTAEPMEAAMPQTRASRQMTSTTGETFFAVS